MVVGVATTLLGYYYLKTDTECGIAKSNIDAGFLMYGSYLFLFAQFFVSRYFGNKTSSQNSKPKKL